MSHPPMIAGQAKFAFDLLRETKAEVEGDESVVISPMSISVALGMVLLGSKDNTAKEIQFTIAKGWLLKDNSLKIV